MSGVTTLRSLALVNHAFYNIAVSYICEHAEVKFFDYASLELAVDEISTEHYRHHMRRLDIMTLPYTWGQTLFDERDIEPSQTPELKKFISINGFMPDAAKSDYTQELLSSWRLPNLDQGRMRLSNYEEKNWEPLIKLIKTVKRLETLNYAAANNFSELSTRRYSPIPSAL